jgi:hypothetical protein
MHIKFKQFLKFNEKKQKRLTIERHLVDKTLNNCNYLSNLVFEFLICMTFLESKGKDDMYSSITEIYAVGEEFLGSYSYRKIGSVLKITNIIKKFKYIKRMMGLEPYHNLYQLIRRVKLFAYTFTRYIKYDGRPKSIMYVNSYFKNNFFLINRLSISYGAADFFDLEESYYEYL